VGPVQFRDLPAAVRPTGSGRPGDQGVVDGVAAAIRLPDQNFGVIAAYSQEPRRFSHDELNFLESVAGVIAAAISRERADRLAEQLQQAQKLEDVGHLAGGIAHDFNNLLALILNYVAFTRERLPPGQNRADLDQALRATRSAADLTSRLLLLSRRHAREPEVLDLNEAIAEMIALLGRTLGEDISLTTDLDPGNPAIEVDPIEIQQILLNLAVNARDAMPGCGTLAIETTTLELEAGDERWPLLSAGEYVCLSVTDSGPGMTEKTRKRAFDPFFTTKGAGEGTGLGLGIVHSIASRAGGIASIASDPGSGTTVSVMLPVQNGAIPDPQVKRRSPPTQGAGQRILLVEDEPGLRRLTERILRSAGYEPVVAATPSEALEEARRMNGGLALMLTDLVMPEMSGAELAIRVTASYPDVGVAFMSGYPGETMRDNPNGLNGAFIEKPFEAEALVALVDQVLSGKPG
jgi:two-component system cell cycle sensor histidine kinase/response regulator CckA